MDDLTFVYTSFAKIFCQNLVKKNRKYVLRFSCKNNGVRRDKCGKFPLLYSVL